MYGTHSGPTYWQQEAGRYTGARTQVRGQWRLSPDRRAAVRAAPPAEGNPLRQPESPVLYAHPDLIAATNLAYEQAHSTLRLYHDTDTELPDDLKGLGLVRAVPGFKPPTSKPVPLLSISICATVAKELMFCPQGKVPGNAFWYTHFRPENGQPRTRRQALPDSGYPESSYLPPLLADPQGTLDSLLNGLPQERAWYRFTWPGPGGDVQVNAQEQDAADDGSGSADEVTAVQQEAIDALVAGQMPKAVATSLVSGFGDIDSDPLLQQAAINVLVHQKAFENADGQEFGARVEAAINDARDGFLLPLPAYDEATPQLRRQMAARYAVNEGASPDIGEAFAAMSTRGWTPQEEQSREALNKAYGNKLPWSYHVAAVTAVTGGARITLENYNRGNRQDGANLWYFEMYGPEPERSFHALFEQSTASPVTTVLSLG